MPYITYELEGAYLKHFHAGFIQASSVVPRARHCGIPAILPPMSLKNAPSAGLRAHLENLLIIFRCFLLFPYLV